MSASTPSTGNVRLPGPECAPSRRTDQGTGPAGGGSRWLLQRSAPGGMRVGFSPVLDEMVLQEHPLDALRHETAAAVSPILATAEHELTTFPWIAEAADNLDDL